MKFGVLALGLMAMCHPVLVATLVSFEERGDDEVTIKRKLTPKEEIRYKTVGVISQTVTVPSGVAQTVETSVEGEAIFTMGDEVDDNKLPFTLLLRNLKVQSSPAQPWDSVNRKITLKAEVDELNAISVDSLQGVNKQDQAMAALVGRVAQGFGTYPCQAIKAGGTWSVSEQGAFLGGKKIEYDIKYEGMKEVDGEKFYELSANADMPVELDLGTMDDNGSPVKPSMVMKGTVHISAEGLVDTNGWLKKMAFETKAEITLDAPDAQGQIKLGSDEIVKLERVS